MDKKVSIITPCFNGEKFLERYLDSILNQTYKNIELILINDGSSDKTHEIVKTYYDKFKQTGIKLTYLFTKNKGQAAALNLGLKLFSGHYLTWPDSDDFLSKDSIEKKVKFLEENKQYGLVRTDAHVLDENDLKKPIKFISNKSKDRFKEELFDDYITENNAWFAPGCFMLRTSAFLDVNPKRDIYESRAGQNWQMLLPIMHKYKCGFIDEPLYNYVVRNDSHSHSDADNLKAQLKKAEGHEDILLHVIEDIFNTPNVKAEIKKSKEKQDIMFQEMKDIVNSL